MSFLFFLIFLINIISRAGVARCMIGAIQLRPAMGLNGTYPISCLSSGNVMEALHIVVSYHKCKYALRSKCYLIYFARWCWNQFNFISVPGKSKRTGRNSCSHQLCECDREFAMCLNKHRPCPKSKASCKNKKRLWQNILMAFTSGHGMHHPHKSGAKYYPNKPTRYHPQKETPRTLNNHLNPFKLFGWSI